MLSSRKGTDTSTDWDLCVICQKVQLKKTTRKLGQQMLQKILQTIVQDHGDFMLINVHDITYQLIGRGGYIACISEFVVSSAHA